MIAARVAPRSRTVLRAVSLGLATVLALGATACKKEASPASSATPSPSATAPESEPKTITLQPLPSRIGAREKNTRKTRLSLEVEFWQDGEKLGSNASVRSEEYEREKEVLGLVGGAPAKIKVRYDHYRLVEQSPDKPKVDSNLLEGHTYVVDATDAPPKITTDKGKPVGPEEADTLIKLHGDLAQDDPIASAIGTAPIPVGKTVPLRQVLFRALLAAGNGEFKSGTVVLDALRPEGNRDAAVFVWKGEMKSEEDNGLEMAWHLKGEAVVGISPAVTLRTKIDGALDVTGHTKRNGGRVDLQGNGTFQDERVDTPL
ncbi:MAG TPA: hypothetical protein VHE30_20920 [Polyangiaceae bacterium]|nr:hypothetical protein [Polyangiaceae bacterium]